MWLNDVCENPRSVLIASGSVLCVSTMLFFGVDAVCLPHDEHFCFLLLQHVPFPRNAV